MRSGLFRDRRTATIVAVALAVAPLFLLWRPSAGDGVALNLALGMFGGVAAALTFALALLVAGTDVWPPARALVLRPTTVAWFALSTTAIVAAVGSALTATQGLQSALTKAAVIAAFLAGACGVAGVVGTLRAVSGSGRRELHARVIRRELRRDGARADALPPSLLDFLPSAAEALANGVFPRFIDRGEDILLAARQACSGEPSLVEAERLSHICLGYEALLARALARDEAVPEISWLLEQLARETACLTGHVRKHGGTFRGVRLLAGQTRMINSLASAASARAHLQPEAADDMRGFLAASERAQSHVRACADPDPPLQYLPTKHPWQGGIVGCPDSTLLWLVAACEQGTQMSYASALYVTHESLFEVKYLGDYQYGRAVPDIQARMRAEQTVPLDAATLLTGSSGQRCSRPLADAWGGVDTTWVTLLSIRLAELAPAHWTATEAGYQGPGWLIDDRQQLADRWRFLVPDLQDPSPQAALALAARCLGRKASTSGLDPWRRAWLDKQHVMAPRSVSLTSQPAFVLLAALLALRKSVAESDRNAASDQFLDCLPPRAVATTLAASGRVLNGSADPRTARRTALGPLRAESKWALLHMLDEVPVL